MPDRVLVVVGTGLVDPATPVLRADDLGVLRGDGVFETLLVTGGTPVLLDAHLDRLARSAGRMDLVAPPSAAWRQAVDTAVEAWGAADGVLRLVCTRGPEDGGPATAYATVAPVPPEVLRQRREGIAVVTRSLGVPASVRRSAPWLLGGVKSTSYAMNMAVLRDARTAGADDVILVSTDGQVLEGPTSTVLWVDAAGAIRTPPAEEVGILAGTTAAAMLDTARSRGLSVRVAPAAVGELADARELALVSSIRGVAPVHTLDGRAVPRGDTLSGLAHILVAAAGSTP